MAFVVVLGFVLVISAVVVAQRLNRRKRRINRRCRELDSSIRFANDLSKNWGADLPMEVKDRLASATRALERVPRSLSEGDRELAELQAEAGLHDAHEAIRILTEPRSIYVAEIDQTVNLPSGQPLAPGSSSPAPDQPDLPAPGDQNRAPAPAPAGGEQSGDQATVAPALPGVIRYQVALAGVVGTAKPGWTIVAQPGSAIIAGPESTVIVISGASVHGRERSVLIVEPGAEFRYDPGCEVIRLTGRWFRQFEDRFQECPN